MCREMNGSKSPADIPNQLWSIDDEGTVLTSDPGELSQVVNDGVARVDVVVDEGDASVGTLAAQDRDSSERHPTWPDDFLRPIRVELCLLLHTRASVANRRNERTGRTSWRETNSASIETIVPLLGRSFGSKGWCLTMCGSRFLEMVMS